MLYERFFLGLDVCGGGGGGHFSFNKNDFASLKKKTKISEATTKLNFICFFFINLFCIFLSQWLLFKSLSVGKLKMSIYVSCWAFKFTPSYSNIFKATSFKTFVHAYIKAVHPFLK